MRKNILIIAIIVSNIVSAQNSMKKLLYDKDLDISNGIIQDEEFDGRGYKNVKIPEIEIFSPKENNTRTAVLICPGGGYGYEADRKSVV